MTKFNKKKLPSRHTSLGLTEGATKGLRTFWLRLMILIMFSHGTKNEIN